MVATEDYRMEKDSLLRGLTDDNIRLVLNGIKRRGVVENWEMRKHGGYINWAATVGLRRVLQSEIRDEKLYVGLSPYGLKFLNILNKLHDELISSIDELRTG